MDILKLYLDPTEDHQLLQVVGEIAADAFAAEAIVLAAADRIQVAVDSVVGGLPDADLARAAQIAGAQAKVAVDRFSYQTASRLFDAGGVSATHATYNLDGICVTPVLRQHTSRPS